MTETDNCSKCGARLVAGESSPSCPKCRLAQFVIPGDFGFAKTD